MTLPEWPQWRAAIDRESASMAENNVFDHDHVRDDCQDCNKAWAHVAFDIKVTRENEIERCKARLCAADMGPTTQNLPTFAPTASLNAFRLFASFTDEERAVLTLLTHPQRFWWANSQALRAC